MESKNLSSGQIIEKEINPMKGAAMLLVCIIELLVSIGLGIFGVMFLARSENVAYS